MKFNPIRMLLPLQLGATLVAVPMLALAPPAQGRILLVPIWPGSGAHLAADEVARGARLVAPGPFAGSLVIDGPREAVTGGLWARGVLVVGAAGVDCGAPTEEGR